MSDDDPRIVPPNPTRRKFLLTTGSSVAATVVGAYVPALGEQLCRRERPSFGK